MFSFSALVHWILYFSIMCLVLVHHTIAVQHGDEAFAPIKDGYFYVFCDGGNQTAGEKGPSIDIVDPYAKKLVKSIPVDPTIVWSDSVYMETCDCFKKTYAIANDRNSHIIVINTHTHTVETTIPVSDKPVHAYAIPPRQEYWAHADGAGVMDVLHISGFDALHEEDIVVHHDTPGHGKLLWDLDIYPRAYLSNTREGFVFEINLETYELTRSFNFSDSEHSCVGTHGLAYSRINKHVYATCSRSAGLAEMDPTNWNILTIHSTAKGGQVYESPDEKYIVTLDKYGDAVHILRPQNTGDNSTIEFPSVNSPEGTPANPGKPAFFRKKDGTWRMYFSLTGMTSYGAKEPTDGGSNGMGYIDIETIEAEPDKTHNMSHVAGGETTSKYRSIYAGGEFVGTIMHKPFSGAMIVKGETAQLHTQVETNKGATRIIWVPKEWSGSACSQRLNVQSGSCPVNDIPKMKEDLENLQTSLGPVNISKMKEDLAKVQTSLSKERLNDDRDSHDGSKDGVTVGEVIGISIITSLLSAAIVGCILYALLKPKSSSIIGAQSSPNSENHSV